jgi:hypothetical protein
VAALLHDTTYHTRMERLTSTSTGNGTVGLSIQTISNARERKSAAASGSSEETPGPTALSPPYWKPSREPSLDEPSSNRPPPISLEDNTLSREPSLQPWAKSININDYVIIRGTIGGVGDYVVFNCTVQTLDGGPLTIRKRYSEFDDLRTKLMKEFPQSTRSSLPALPPKSAVYKFRPKFLERRREGLAYFLQCVMLNPQYSTSHIVKDFIFPPAA